MYFFVLFLDMYKILKKTGKTQNLLKTDTPLLHSIVKIGAFVMRVSVNLLIRFRSNT